MANAPINEVWPDPNHTHVYEPITLRKLMIKAGLKIMSESQACKWDSFLRDRKVAEGFPGIVSVITRGLLGVFSLIPYRFLWSERGFLPHKKYQQLIKVGEK